mmetsp:Transcript_24247/g.70167  ORF Transcript_24247/g.70167 Transcript_24247/m.70167 type:complete len:445 (+) Transcript_24247:473-1807(+)
MVCKINCYGDAATPVPLPGGTGEGVPANSQQACRDICMATKGCEAIVYGNNRCYGKKDVRTSKCQIPEGWVTEMITAPFGTCTLMGDPHILSFDNPNGHHGALLQLVAGDYWLLKNTALQIQARFGYSSRFPSAASSVGVAVGGDLIQGHKLQVLYTGPAKGHEGFKAFWDGSEILQGFPSTYTSGDSILKASLKNMNPQDFHPQARHTIGGTSGDLPSYLFELIPDIRIYLLIGEETVNIVITIRRPDGSVDGYCGNFNCVWEDDRIQDLQARGVAGKITSGSLFEGTPPSPPSSMTPSGGTPGDINNCNPDLLSEAQAACDFPEEAIKDSCVYDVCTAGGVEGVAQMDVVAGALGMEASRHFEVFGMKLPALFGASLPAQVQWGFAVLLVALASTGAVLGWKTKRAGARGGFGFVQVAAEDEDVDEDEEALLPAGEYDAVDC